MSYDKSTSISDYDVTGRYMRSVEMGFYDSDVFLSEYIIVMLTKYT